MEVVTVAACMTNIESLIDITPKKPRSKDVERERGWWENGYRNWNDERFKKVLRVNKDTFDFILSQIRVHIVKQPTNMKPNLIPPETTLALTMYRLAHGCSFTTLEDLFSWSIANCEKEFNHCCRILVTCLYDRYVCMPANDDEWKEEPKDLSKTMNFFVLELGMAFLFTLIPTLKIFSVLKSNTSLLIWA